MRVLHICSDFCYTKVHSQLYCELDKIGVEQIVFTYMRNPDFTGSNSFASKNTHFVYCPILKMYHRALYHLKLNDVYKALKGKVDLSTIDIIHCSTLFSDAGVAYKAKKEYGIPYITGVRSTDVDIFMVYAFHTWYTGRKIIKHASHLVFITQMLKDRFDDKLMIKGMLSELKGKISIRSNGIDNFWHNNVVEKRPHNNFNILYVGSFLKRKKTIDLAHAVLALKKKYPSIKITYVGKGGKDEEKILGLAHMYPDIITYKGAVNDKNTLKDIYRESSLFALPSIRETFGLVYIEALSQGVPVLYTRGDGVDGLLSPKVGISVVPNKEGIQSGIEKIFENYPDTEISKYFDLSKYKWGLIAKSYKNLYEHICNKNNLI